MHVEPATSKDVELLAKLNATIHRLHRKLAPEYFVEAASEAIRLWLDEESAHGLIAWEGSTPVGYCLLKIIEREPNAWTVGFRRLLVDQLSVEPEWRRRGAGTLLMDAACRFAREQQIDEVVLEYWSNNEMARAFYASLGFTPLTEKVLLKIRDTALPDPRIE
jgi:ribosomal protein S18 acetylase RimI-like enzyme